jgi:hypothetical protein
VFRDLVARRESACLRYLLGRDYGLLGDVGKARREFERALGLDETHLPSLKGV